MKKITVSLLLSLGLALSSCASRQGVPGTATPESKAFVMGSNVERPSSLTTRAGDTVYGLAYQYGITSRSLIAANGLQPPYTLTPGQDLTLPAPQEHVVISGETAPGIAEFYGVDLTVLARENNLEGAYSIKAGDRLVIPTRDTVSHNEALVASDESTIETSTLAPLTAEHKGAHKQVSSPAAPQITMTESDIQAELRKEREQETTSAPAPLKQAVVEEPQKKSDAPFVPIPPVKAASTSPKTTAEAVAHAVSRHHAPTPQKKPVTRDPHSVAAPVAQKASPVSSGYVWPADKKGKVLSTFGETYNGARNDGINIALAEGTPVLSTAPGKVVYAGNALKGFGNLVLIKHADGYMTAYGHNSKLLVGKGDTVGRGQKIAESGATGDVKSPQLHFELRKGTQPVDPSIKLGS